MPYYITLKHSNTKCLQQKHRNVPPKNGERITPNNGKK